MTEVCMECEAMRARVAELEQKVEVHERSIKDLDYLLGLAKAHALEEVAQRDAAYAANATLAQQVAALADALEGMTRSVYRCYEHNDDLGDAMDRAKAALRAAGRKRP